jgi:hypothetical protein
VRTTILKNIVGVFLLPLAWISTETFVGALTRTTVHQQYWRTEDFWFFMLGIVLWLVVFTGNLYMKGKPPALWFYVLGHEWTHAIWAWLSNGEVSEIKVHRDGGHILTNKPTVLVTLAPYFYPVLCAILIFIFCIFQIFYPLDEAPPLLNGPFLYLSPLGLFVFLLGAAWGFHMSFTVWMIRRGQSDLRMHGNLFSIVLIYLGNLMVLTLFLILTAPGVGVRSCAREFLLNTVDFSDAVWNLCLFFRSLV